MTGVLYNLVAKLLKFKKSQHYRARALPNSGDRVSGVVCVCVWGGGGWGCVCARARVCVCACMCDTWWYMNVVWWGVVWVVLKGSLCFYFILNANYTQKTITKKSLNKDHHQTKPTTINQPPSTSHHLPTTINQPPLTKNHHQPPPAAQKEALRRHERGRRQSSGRLPQLDGLFQQSSLRQL